MIVWADTETTGLDERWGALLEVALVMTDDELNEGKSMSVVIKPPIPLDQLKMDDVVREMHTKNGLLTDIEKNGVSLADAERKLCEWFLERCASPGTLPLAGSTIGFDRRWIRMHMPLLEKMFSYRSIDVSSLTELASRWNIPVYNKRPKKDKGIAHRAIDDLRYYQRKGFINESQDRITR